MSGLRNSGSVLLEQNAGFLSPRDSSGQKLARHVRTEREKDKRCGSVFRGTKSSKGLATNEIPPNILRIVGNEIPPPDRPA